MSQVNLYTTRTPPVLQAVFWQGDESVLQQFSKTFPEQRRISVDGTLHFMNDDGKEHTAMCNLSFVVLGVTGYFFVVEVSEFVQTYVRVDAIHEPA